MNATIFPEKKKHYPVLLDEIISIITPQYGGTFIDCTLGQGGYSKKILEYDKSKVIAIDRDPDCLKIARNLKKDFQKRFFFKNEKFSKINKIDLKNENVKGVIFDLGYSYSQIKDLKRGFSFNSYSDLNMKMGLNNFSARDVIYKLNQQDLEKIFKFFGNEEESKKIAFNIVKNREKIEIDTQKLVQIIENSKKRRNYKINTSTKVFQALRIFVNKEISELIFGLINAAKILEKGGVIAVVSFHSLEDKIVKFFFQNLSQKKSISRYLPKKDEKENSFRLLNKKPIIPSKEEIKINPPSRSAKLRFIVKEKEISNFEKEILEKFNFLLEIENLSKKI